MTKQWRFYVCAPYPQAPRNSRPWETSDAWKKYTLYTKSYIFIQDGIPRIGAADKEVKKKSHNGTPSVASWLRTKKRNGKNFSTAIVCERNLKNDLLRSLYLLTVAPLHVTRVGCDAGARWAGILLSNILQKPDVPLANCTRSRRQTCFASSIFTSCRLFCWRSTSGSISRGQVPHRFALSYQPVHVPAWL